LVRGTSTRQPNSGLFSNQASWAHWLTTSPITRTPAPTWPLAAFTAADTSPRVVRIDRWSTVVQLRVIATGVRGSRPAMVSTRQMSRACSAPSRTTTVACGSARLGQSTSVSWALTTRTSRACPPVSENPA